MKDAFLGPGSQKSGSTGLTRDRTGQWYRPKAMNCEAKVSKRLEDALAMRYNGIGEGGSTQPLALRYLEGIPLPIFINELLEL